MDWAPLLTELSSVNLARVTRQPDFTSPEPMYGKEASQPSKPHLRPYRTSIFQLRSTNSSIHKLVYSCPRRRHPEQDLCGSRVCARGPPRRPAPRAPPDDGPHAVPPWAPHYFSTLKRDACLFRRHAAATASPRVGRAQEGVVGHGSPCWLTALTLACKKSRVQ